jgi:hypothetical protein
VEWECHLVGAAGIWFVLYPKLHQDDTLDIAYAGGTLVTHGEISVGDLTSLLLYTVYVGSGLQMLT